MQKIGDFGVWQRWVSVLLISRAVAVIILSVLSAWLSSACLSSAPLSGDAVTDNVILNITSDKNAF